MTSNVAPTAKMPSGLYHIKLWEAIDGSRNIVYTYTDGEIDGIEYSDGATSTYKYDAWGNWAVSGGDVGTYNSFRYRGYYYDTAIMLYYLKTRWYDPETGRFISPDSINYLDPQSINGLNLYAYCLNNPVMGYDPDGTLDWWQKLLIGAAFILVGAAVTAATAGTGTGLLAAFGAALLTSAKAVAVSTAISAGIGFVVVHFFRFF